MKKPLESLAAVPVIVGERKWVHQEIGYAMALNIPVLPVAIGSLPGEMIDQIHAVSVAQDDVLQLSSRLTVDAVRALVDANAARNIALYACADSPQARATAIAQHCEDILPLGRFGKVRQKGVSLHSTLRPRWSRTGNGRSATIPRHTTMNTVWLSDQSGWSSQSTRPLKAAN
jgi:hypothetical protein